MQRDKATLMVGSETQLARALRLLGQVCHDVFISVRQDQIEDVSRQGYPQIVDRIENVGPAAGILAALATRPENAWLVVAVDLPLLDAATLDALVRARDSSRMATAYRSRHDGMPEPLCAIWEPTSRIALESFINGGKNCPRKFLLNHPAHIVDLATANALANINTPEEYAAVIADARGAQP
jgi:molybdopterin-guanine dinucleotide biosynthesis protein A